MRRLTLTLVLLAPLCLVGSAHASPSSPSIDMIMRSARAAIVVPVEWDGVWTTLDSVYTCLGVFQSTSTSTDTICGGKDYTPDSQGLPFTMDCTGTATATTFDMTCTGSGEIYTDCIATFTIVSHGTLLVDSYHMVATINTTYSGASCSFLPPTCSQIDSWGTRTSPAPTDYCSTPVTPSSWGRVKTIYR